MLCMLYFNSIRFLMKLSRPTRTQAAAAAVGTAGIGAAAYLAKRHYELQHDKFPQLVETPQLVTFYNANGGHIEFKRNYDETDREYIRYNIYIVNNGISTKQQERLAITQDTDAIMFLHTGEDNPAKYKGFHMVSVRNQNGLLWYQNPSFYTQSEYPLPEKPDVIIANVVAGEHDKEAYPSSVSYSNQNTGRITFAKSTLKSQDDDYVFYDIFFNENSPTPLLADMWQLLVPLNKTANVKFQKSNNGMVSTQSPYKGFIPVPVLNGKAAWHEAEAFYNNSEYPLRSPLGITTTVPFLDLC